MNVLNRKMAFAVITIGAAALSACSGGGGDVGGSGGGGGQDRVEVRRVDVVDASGNRSTPVVQTTADDAAFTVEWNVASADGSGGPIYRTRLELVSRGGANNGQAIEILSNWNCGIGFGPSPRCNQGDNSMPCDFDPASNGTVLRCPAGNNPQQTGYGTAANVGQFFANSVGLPGEYDVRVRACITNSAAQTECDVRSRTAHFE